MLCIRLEMRVNVYWTILCFVDSASRYIMCNENQLDALFILSLFRQSTSTCFGHICSPSSGGILYVYSNWYVFCFLVDCLLSDTISLHGCILDSCTENVWHNKITSLSILNIPLEDEVVEFQT